MLPLSAHLHDPDNVRRTLQGCFNTLWSHWHYSEIGKMVSLFWCLTSPVSPFARQLIGDCLLCATFPHLSSPFHRPPPPPPFPPPPPPPHPVESVCFHGRTNAISNVYREMRNRLKPYQSNAGLGTAASSSSSAPLPHDLLEYLCGSIACSVVPQSLFLILYACMSV